MGRVNLGHTEDLNEILAARRRRVYLNINPD